MRDARLFFERLSKICLSKKVIRKKVIRKKVAAPSNKHDLALLLNIRLGWKGLKGTNTLAYYKHCGRKKFYSIWHWPEFSNLAIVCVFNTYSISYLHLKHFNTALSKRQNHRAFVVALSVWRHDTELNDTGQNVNLFRIEICYDECQSLDNCFELHCANCYYVKSHYAICHYAKCHYAKCHYAKCHYAKCHYAKCHYAKCHYAKCHYTKCHYTKCHYAKYTKCHYTKCHYAKCQYANRNNTKLIMQNVIIPNANAKCHYTKCQCKMSLYQMPMQNVIIQCCGHIMVILQKYLNKNSV